MNFWEFCSDSPVLTFLVVCIIADVICDFIKYKYCNRENKENKCQD